LYRTLKLAIERGVATVTLNRPEARNAMSAELMHEMIACAGEIAARGEIDVVIVQGSGVCFSAGADLKDASRWGNAARPFDEQREIAALGYRMARAWEELPQVTIAAIEGYAIGGWLALVAALDWRVIADNACVALPESALGIPLTWGTLPRLVNLVGPARAVAKQVLALPRNSVRMTKESINAYASIGAHAASHMAHDQVQLAAGSAEAKAAREAFAAKRRKDASAARSRGRCRR